MKPISIISCAAVLLLCACTSGTSDFKEFSYAPVPETYKVLCDKAGTLERIDYQAVDADADMADKSAYVYVPYGYSQKKKYDIIYIMHGAQANNTFYLGTNEDPKEMKHMFDHLIADGQIPSVLLVMPTIFNDAKPREEGLAKSREVISSFQDELRDVLVPLVEGRYSTYAQSTSEEDLEASRDHRYFTGFSMGSCTTWGVFLNNMKYFHTFIPCSGSSTLGRRAEDLETAYRDLSDCVARQGFSPKDFNVFSLTGKTDFASTGLIDQIQAMSQDTDVFSFGTDLKNNNLYLYVYEAGEHNAEYFANYLYSALPYILQ